MELLIADVDLCNSGETYADNVVTDEGMIDIVKP